MRLIPALIVLASLARAASAQETAEQKLDRKLQSPFLSKAAWFTDYDKALEAAKKDGKLVFAFFTRSYAPCGFCTKCEKELLETDGFVAWAKDYVLLCHITSKVEGEKHPDLLTEKGGRGFPFLVFMDAGGKVLAEHKGDRTLEKLAETAARAKGGPAAEPAKKKDSFERLAADLEDGDVECWAEAQARLKALGELTKEQKEKIAPALNVLEAKAAISGAKHQKRETLAAAGKPCAAMKKEGRVPSADKRVLTSFWLCIVEYQASEKDLPALEEAIKELDACIGGTEGGTSFIAGKRKQLEELKAEAKKTAEKPAVKTGE